ncbi:hypothetical protein [Tropicimonas sp. IMCC34043]|uniref:hypothetical protein n=1 Tax=Tropicimonas sp. IMCC34043 TaxID=2248760 RepID=UPI001300A782|nr:hypothetical protein [Tropicimonas sp. IMCC34043]
MIVAFLASSRGISRHHILFAVNFLRAAVVIVVTTSIRARVEAPAKKSRSTKASEMRDQQTQPVKSRVSDKAQKQQPQSNPKKKQPPHGEPKRRPPSITDYASI